jgi:hypothetical protein
MNFHNSLTKFHNLFINYIKTLVIHNITMADTFECILCSKVFTRKCNLDYHISHNVCQRVNLRKCDHCGYIFKNSHLLTYHIEHQVCLKKPKLVLKKDDMDHDLTKENEKLRLAVATLQGENKALREHPQSVTQSVVNNYNQVNIITDFGTEKVENILHKNPSLLDDTITHHLNDSIPYLTKEIHCNREVYPEYNNLYMTKYHSPYMMVYQEGRFQRKNKVQALDDLIEQFIHILGNYIDDHDFGQKIFERYERYRDSVVEGGERRKDLENELIGILIDFCELYKMDQVAEQIRKEYTSKT